MTGTRASTKEDSTPTCHVLNYFYDTENGFALTALVHTLRFHVMVDYARLESAEVQEEYMALLDGVRAKYGDAGDQARRDKVAGDEGSRKRKRDDSDSGYGSSPVGSPARSGRGTRGRKSESSVTLADDDREDVEGPVRDLQNWVLAPFGDTFAARAPAEEESRAKTVRDWYHGAVSYWTLTCDANGQLSPKEEEPTKPLETGVAELIPSLKLPKYITSAGLPLFSTSDLGIEATSDTPSPRHPAVVKAKSDSETYFLKLVDPNQPGPFKRELKLLREIEDKSVHEKIRVPLVRGLVVDDASAELSHKTTSADRACSVLGFLLTAIPDPTPLTVMLDTDAAEAKREEWAAEVERTVEVLHQNGIVWGDAKADNFVVDAKGKLWVIDFGGSYTEGWVDPELNETIEGDDQGTEKIVNAVRNPEEFTFDPDDDGEGKGQDNEGKEQEDDEGKEQDGEGKEQDDEGTEQDGRGEEQGGRGRSVKRRKTDEDEETIGNRQEIDEKDREEKDVVSRPHKFDNSDESDDTTVGGDDEKKYCYCDGSERGQMIGCDGEDCKRAWFHVDCTDLDAVPSEDEKWFCDECKVEE